MDLSHSELARKYFREGYNCAQSVFLAFQDLHGMDTETALMISSSFGGGMGRLREVCGALTGSFMAVGMLMGYVENDDKAKKTEHYARIQQLAKEFEAEHGAIVCRELLALGVKTQSPVPEDRTEEYYKVRPCEHLVASSAKILDDYLESVGYKVADKK